MVSRLSAKISLFLYVRNHSQLQYYLKLAESRSAANEGRLSSSSKIAMNVVAIHPLGRRSSA
jgi:hypothetical protein